MAIEGADIVKAAAFLGAGISMGLGAIGPGVGEGMVAAKACEAIGKNPKEAGLLTRTMLVGQAVSESTGIYSLVIALLLLFVVSSPLTFLLSPLLLPRSPYGEADSYCRQQSDWLCSMQSPKCHGKTLRVLIFKLFFNLE